ncbi:prephenate dehydratase domain-containing protein [Bifidobacterium indicum]|uniref:prephenate dehydratase domain-containing protein n=1 Tax=Bifidobacterium indicum TaxID=1691 RepID=UPI002624D206|nr:prephenate dehydratase domain-containing protein [uncultured Bifidobacterium sp.]
MSTGQTSRVDLYYLGPQGSFTHQAAVESSACIGPALGRQVTLVPCDRATRIVDAVEAGRGWGIIAWENNVEGHVIPNMDALIDSTNVAGFGRTGLSIVFDAFVRPDHGDLTTISAHPHGLAQCREFIRSTGLREEAASSNAAACRDLRRDQVALGPRICGSLYGLETRRSAVQDYRGARTDFLLLAPRGEAAGLARAMFGQPEPCGQGDAENGARSGSHREFESIVTFIPLHTGSGVLADLLDRLRDTGLNMTSFMSRPIKGNDGTYSFIATIDAAPWEPSLGGVMQDLLDRGDWIKTLAVYPRRERPDPPVLDWMLPRAGAWMERHLDKPGIDKELLW